MMSVSNQWCAEKLNGFLTSAFKIESEDLPNDTSRLESWLNWPDGKGGKYFTKIVNPKLLYKGDIIIRDPAQDYIAIVYEGGSVSIKYKIAEGNSSLKKFIKKEATGPVTYILRAKGATSPAPILVQPKNGKTQSNFITNGANMDGLNSEFRRRVEGMAAEFIRLTGKRMTVSGPRSAYRSYDQQVQIYKTSRAGYAARPGTSNHGFGFALDVNTSDVNRAVSLGLLQKYGLYRPMLSSHPYEPWHIEPIGLNKSSLSNYRANRQSGQFTGDQLAFALPNKWNNI